jgi:hypothetical protein
MFSKLTERLRKARGNRSGGRLPLRHPIAPSDCQEGISVNA